MDEEEKRLKAAELYAKLSESARDRFNSRRKLEWGAALGLWTLFGGAAGVTITARTWSPWWPEDVVAFILSVVVIFVYVRVWIPWVNRAHRRDSMTAYYWESGVRLMLGTAIADHKDLPEFLQPREPQQDDGDLWPNMHDQNPDNVGGAPESAKRRITASLHAAQKVQILITIAFAVMFVGAVWSKHANSSQQQIPTSGNPNRMLLEGDVEIDTPSRIKVGQ